MLKRCQKIPHQKLYSPLKNKKTDDIISRQIDKLFTSCFKGKICYSGIDACSFQYIFLKFWDQSQATAEYHRYLETADQTPSW